MDHKSVLDFSKELGAQVDGADNLWLQTLTALTRRLEAHQQELEKVRRENRELRRQLSDISNSRVWKATGPVRRLLEVIKK